MSIDHPRVMPVPALPDPTAHAYNHCTRAGDFVFIAGQCGVGDDGVVVPGGFRAQAERVFERLALVTTAAGGSPESIVAMTVFITDIRNGKEFVGMRHEFFNGKDFPTSALIGVAALMPPGAEVEVQATAFIPRQGAQA